MTARMNRRLMAVLVLMLTVAAGLHAQQRRNATYEAYIQQYKDVAIDQMRQYHIPASITLAQGLLESGAGKGQLAVRSNNHFGIKCHSDWKGPRTYKDDDNKNDCFRVYSRVADSYTDHSKFLQQTRYKRLFALDPLDYKGWAYGLKACGYATDSKYGDKLISLIELYDLHQYDTNRFGQTVVKPKSQSNVSLPAHRVVLVNDIVCAVATGNETWDQIAQEFGISKKKLLKYNEVYDSYPLYPGMNVFLKKKKTKAAKQYKDYWHRVKAYESMYSVSQQYGIRLKNLYKMNYRDVDYIPQEGDLLKVR